MLEGLHVGRISEIEPNDAFAAPARLPPLWRGSTLEVVGTVGTGQEAWGLVDPDDHHRVGLLAQQHVALSLQFVEDDVALGGANDLSLALLDAADGSTLDEVSGSTSPLVLAVEGGPSTPLLVRVRASTGHAPYVLSIQLSPSVLLQKGVSAATAAGWSPDASAAFVAVDPPGRASTQDAPRCASGHVLVSFAEGIDGAAVLAAHGLTPLRPVGCGACCVAFPSPLEGSGEAEAVRVAARLAALPGVRWATPDWLMTPLAEPSDARFAEQWNVMAVGGPGAWELTEGDPAVVVGVVDTGIVPHPDLVGRLVPGFDFISDPIISGDGDGRDTDPHDEGDGLWPSGTSTWHGTHIAAIIVAANNDTYGIAGLAPGCRVMPLRALGRTGGQIGDVADAILFAAGLAQAPDGTTLAEPLRVVNISAGIAIDSPVLREACDLAAAAGVLLVAAAGNTGSSPIIYPARYESVLCVGACATELTSTSYSNFGPEMDLIAPGGDTHQDAAGDGGNDGILSCWLDETLVPASAGHMRSSGTSQAAPHVAAAAALLLSREPGLDLAQLQSYLFTTARDVDPPGHDLGTGHGFLQVHEALRAQNAALLISDLRPPRLLLPWTSMYLSGLEDLREMPLLNGGGGVLLLGAPTAWTHDGAPWLSASVVAAQLGGPAISHDTLAVSIDQDALPAAPDWSHGIVTIVDLLGTPLGRVTIVVGRGVTLRAGADLRVAPIDADGPGTFAPRLARATSDVDYRFWLRRLPMSPYLLRAGEDRDRDGFFCEPGDFCGWHGGATEGQAQLLFYSPSQPAGAPLEIRLFPPP